MNDVCTSTPPAGTTVNPNYQHPSNNENQGGGDCAEYGCAKEVTLLEILNGMRSVPASLQSQANQTGTQLTDTLNSTASSMFSAMSDKINQFLQNSGLENMFSGWQQFNPLADVTSSNCSIPYTWQGNSGVLSYCDEQPMIHTLVGWMFFVFFSMRMFTLVTDSRGNSNALADR